MESYKLIKEYPIRIGQLNMVINNSQDVEKFRTEDGYWIGYDPRDFPEFWAEVDSKGRIIKTKAEFFIAYQTTEHDEEGSVSIKREYKDSFEICEDIETAKAKFNEFKKLDSLFTGGYAKIIESTDHV